MIGAVESHRQKYCCFRLPQITPISDTIPSHTEGRFAIVTDVGHGMRWTRQRFARDGIAGQVGERPVSDQQRADERCCSVRRSRVVLTPRRWRQVRGVASAQPGLDKTYPLTTVAKEPGHRGEHDISVCRGKARFLRGCKSLPARVAPAGSNRSRREGNDLSEAFDGKGR